MVEKKNKVADFYERQGNNSKLADLEGSVA